MNLNPRLDPQWRVVSDDNLINLRSNVAAFWKLSRSKELKDIMGELLEIQGVGTGDFHAGNVTDVSNSKGGRRFVLVDVDDGGLKVPLILDFLRGVLVNRWSEVPSENKDLIKAYMKGLSGEAPNEKKFLKELSEQKKLKEKDEYALSFVTLESGTYRFNGKKGIGNIDEMPPDITSFFDKIQRDLEASLSGAKILARGFRMKDVGGSQHRPRFWFFVQSAEGFQVIEAKFLPEAASFYFSGEKLTHTERMEAISSFYRSENSASLNVVTTNLGYSFLIREREQVLFDIEVLRAEEKSSFVRRSEEFLSQWLGFRHKTTSPHSQRLVSLFEEAPQNFYERFEAALKFYEENLKTAPK